MMLKSPNSQDSADDGLGLGKLCKIWQTAKKTHITCGYTKELPKESTNLGSDTKLCYQTGKSPDCSTRMERFGTKTGSQCGIPKREISQPSSHRTRKVWRRYKRVEKTINTTHSTTKRRILKRYIFLTQIQKLSIHLSQCKYRKMIFLLMHYYLYISAIQGGQIRHQKQEAQTCTKKGLSHGKSSTDKHHQPMDFSCTQRRSSATSHYQDSLSPASPQHKR